MANAYNIPSVTPQSITEQLTDIYADAFEQNTLNEIPSVNLVGPMGVGKSSIVYEIARRLSSRIGIPVSVRDIRLLNYSPIDLKGVPFADVLKEFTVWLKPKIFDFSEEPGLCIIFLDEISSAPQSLQAAAYQIALDKKIGEHSFPENCIVICAGNRTVDKSVVFRMPKALANRMMHFEITPDFQSWYEWALEKGLDSRVIGYLAFANNKLNAEPHLEELAFTTPRSWEFVSRLLKITGKEPRELHDPVSGCIGLSAAGEFEAWCKVYKQLPSVADILSGKCTKPVKGMDITYALLTSLLSAVMQRGEEISSQELSNACSYVSRFPADFAALFFRGLLKMEGMNIKLAKVQPFLDWSKRNRHFL